MEAEGRGRMERGLGAADSVSPAKTFGTHGRKDELRSQVRIAVALAITFTFETIPKPHDAPGACCKWENNDTTWNMKLFPFRTLPPPGLFFSELATKSNTASKACGMLEYARS